MNPAWLLYLGSGLQIASNVFGAKQAIDQGKYEADILRYQARYLDAQKRIEEARIKRTLRQTLSTQKAATAASGFRTDVGTPIDIQIDSEMQADLDIALMRSAGSMEQLRLNTQAHMARAEGYGMAAGLYSRALGAGVDTLLSYGSRHGWFEPKTKITVPQLTERQRRLGV